MGSPFSILANGGVTSAKGYKAAGVAAGIKNGKKEKRDVALLVSDVPAAAAGVYTTNAVQAAPLLVTKETVSQNGLLQAVIVNAGNANACTGEQGMKDARRMQELTAEALQIKAEHVAVASTGVIGVLMPMDRVSAGIAEAGKMVSLEGGSDFSEAILTTDLVKKEIAVQLEIDGQAVTIGGAAKGSGMIHPNMATMLGFITTDAKIGQTDLQELLRQVTTRTFNRITVDGDTSTNDMVIVLANGKAKNQTLSPSHPAWSQFVEAFEHVALYLAKSIARDGEGATRLVVAEVTGARSESDAEMAAKTIVGSSLVKTAVFGADANWGRLMMAVGKSGAFVDPNQVEIWIGSVKVAENGMGLDFDEEAATKELQQDPVVFRINLNVGQGKATAYGCDLTYEYVKINGSYRT
ncbi:bifunctional glutamate N-acetyltransferase/amino-acid acetyltransferase ArgJ [Effusibacillus dendaii]|uniref:Arginine biosynthesis bifunctional protein ArgJ n=1 Tax=Effusibacillus dendaii TaxID=2743772 RepID=A0A7I8DCK8_9BACL|nr:bifunctional glutamate N-acetyltransferase/amino-acid acetyltransferase ArgJ [Effusibacillus dendaii]BCJ87898.1 bifunctional glutamate N-acetyltransferase/amino-acid acetyltransferase ArgJ [Effusibacillus dendaii]